MPACPLNHWHFLPLSPPSQVILIKSVSLAWQAKIIGEVFWMPFTLNGACFFPFSRLFYALPLLLLPPLPLPPLIFWQVVTYLPLLPSFFFHFHLIFRREIWINFPCVADGTTFCELQILANTAIYLKWQIRQSNLPESRRFFELSSFERVCVRSCCRGKSQGKCFRQRDFNVKYNSTKQDRLGLKSLLCLNVKGTVGQRLMPTASSQTFHAFSVTVN